MLSHPKIDTQGSEPNPQIHKSVIDHHHLSDAIVSFLAHMFAPTGYLQCNSTSSWSQSSPYVHEINRAHTIVVDDDYVVVDELDNNDGGPLCREATIASWKVKSAHTKRRRSLQWLGSVINNMSSDHGMK